MRLSGRLPGAGFLALAVTALLLPGCVAAGVATVAAGGTLGYAFSDEEAETTASTAPVENGTGQTYGQTSGQSSGQTWSPAAEPMDLGEPAVLVEPQAPVEQVEIQPIQ